MNTIKLKKWALIIFAILCIGTLVWGATLGFTQVLEERLLPKTGTVRIIGEPNHGLRNFASTDELRVWLAQDTTDSSIILTANKEGIINFDEQCEEYALQLQDHAFNDGFIMSFAIMSRIDYYNKFRKWLESGTSHALNLVIIGNDVYLVEPQSDEFWQIAVLD